MPKKIAQLKKLKEVAEIALNSELARLSDIKREEEAPRARLKEIEQARTERATAVTGSDDFDMASLMGVDRAWEAWAKREQMQAMTVLAQIAERREMQLEQTRRAFGKKDALEQVTEGEKTKR